MREGTPSPRSLTRHHTIGAIRPDAAVDTENVTVTPPHQKPRSRTIRRLVIAMIAGAAVLGVAAALTVTVLSMSPLGVPSCSWFGERALASQEEFVSERLPDAHGFEVATYDCDSGGRAFLDFTVPISSAQAGDLFLADSQCRVAEEDDDDGELLSCWRDDKLVTIYLSSSDGRTRGELYVEPRF